MNFSSFALSSPILKAVTAQGYQTPSPIQAKAIPAVLTGKDIVATAQTGTGKTAGFVLPILERLSKTESVNQIRALILTPTRELAAQVNDSVNTYGKNLPLRSTAVFGGVKIYPQIRKLRKGVDILVATPGRLLDLYNQKAVNFKRVEILVLDEADRMLDMGFIHDIRKITALLPKQRQSLMFSATFSNEVRKLAEKLVKQPIEISVSPRNTPAETVKQWVYPVDKKQKPALLTHLIREEQWKQALVFTKTKHGADQLTRYLESKKIQAAAIHGNKSQAIRTKALANFKKGTTQILVATDIAARGIDIERLPQVVNFDLPSTPEDYVHRIGRTGRATKKGQALSLVCAAEAKLLFSIERLIKQQLSRKLVEGFEPIHALPTAGTKQHAKRARKPKIDHKDGQRSTKRPRNKTRRKKKSLS